VVASRAIRREIPPKDFNGISMGGISGRAARRRYATTKSIMQHLSFQINIKQPWVQANGHFSGYDAFVGRIRKEVTDKYFAKGNRMVIVLLYCNSGRHRSVGLANLLAYATGAEMMHLSPKMKRSADYG
jgi:hypothetical protein